jgi:serine/threonine-protein kinase
VGEVDARLGGGYFLAMERLPHALDRILRAQYPALLALSQALRVTQQMTEGLQAVHGAGFVHRDVKPSNIMLRADGTPVLTDFGLVGVTSEGAAGERLTATNVFMGTADYLAPEVVQGAEAAPGSDLYALGVVLYELLAGQVPFEGRAPLEVLRAQVEEELPPLPPDVPDAARAMVERALRKRRQPRWLVLWPRRVPRSRPDAAADIEMKEGSDNESWCNVRTTHKAAPGPARCDQELRARTPGRWGYGRPCRRWPADRGCA